MENIIRRAIAPNARRYAFTGYRPAKMPLGYDELDPRCIDFKKRLMRTILMLIEQKLLSKGRFHPSRHEPPKRQENQAVVA